jgi:dienelactone hydrolase
VDSLLIIVHGVRGNANDYFCDALAAVPASVGVVAPWFGDEEVKLSVWSARAACNANAQLCDSTSLYWDDSTWIEGAAAFNSPGTASYAAMDALITLISKTAAQGRVKQVVLAGFSAGGQLTQRYAWASTLNSSLFTPSQVCGVRPIHLPIL